MLLQLNAHQKIELILQDVWRGIREDMAAQSEIRFGWLKHTFLHTIDDNKIYIALPKEYIDYPNSITMEKGKIEILERIRSKTGLTVDIKFRWDLF